MRIGCSGWFYQHWRGLFYPEKLAVKRWFAFYAETFDTVEINNSFYRLPAPKTFKAWRDRAPPGFCHAVKANRFLALAKKPKDCEEALARQMASLKPPKPALGPILRAYFNNHAEAHAIHDAQTLRSMVRQASR